jgi:isoleucyl-tRNA synthetase
MTVPAPGQPESAAVPPAVAGDYRATLNLPRTNFTMKANLTQREPALLAQWKQENLYQRLRRRRHPQGRWILHDGPPYANGDIHMGHLINKVLKDIVVKYRSMQGYDCPFVPGWDCHGLPIESTVQKQLGPKMRQMTPQEIRRQCRGCAEQFVALQSESFQRLGVLGDFTRPYLTLDPRYEAAVLEMLAELLSRQLVYRQLKPVHWCTADQTALAEAELEYRLRKDPSIFVQLPMYPSGGHWPPAWGPRPKNASLLIWTTTPWTLPANRAVAVHPDHEYVCVHAADHSLIVARQLVATVMPRLPITGFTVSAPLTGSELAALGLSYQHPLEPPRRCPIITADYVTLEDGTGLVHTAPGHGAEDYLSGCQHNLEIYCPVLADGRYDDTVPADLRGQIIWKANKSVLEHLRADGLLLAAGELEHSYPHCWRCHKPTILRATEQWFIRASGESRLLKTAQAFVEQVRWIPDWGKNRITGMLQTRPDWCISRQRYWGIPIPAFFTPDGRVLLTAKSVRQVANHVRQHGADSWFTDSPTEILGTAQWDDEMLDAAGAAADAVDAPTQDPNQVETESITPGPARGGAGQSLRRSWADRGVAFGETWPRVDSPTAPTPSTVRRISTMRFNTAELRQGADILDVWFESGASHRAVLEGTHPELGYPATMYLEGSDQHRGWFQASLLEAAGDRSLAPFQQVLTHGFVVDAAGRKMSKSEGNDIKVADALKTHGADILRLWVASVDYQNDVPCSKELFVRLGEAYRKIRNTIRYLLGNLYDFDARLHRVAPAPCSIDLWMRHRLAVVGRAVHKAYDQYEFHRVYRLLYEFCNVDISAIYAKGIKDRLYCELPESPRRRASQTVCWLLLTQLVEWLAPVLAFTAEEAWQAILQLPGGREVQLKLETTSRQLETGNRQPETSSIHEQVFSPPIAAPPPELVQPWAIFMPLVEDGLKQLDTLKRSVGLGNALDAEAIIVVPIGHPLEASLPQYGPELEDVLGVGFHRIEHGQMWGLQIHDTRSRYASCARSWKRRPDVGSDPEYPDLSARDAAVLRELKRRQTIKSATI